MTLNRTIVNEFTGIKEAQRDIVQEVMGLTDNDTKSLNRVKGKLLYTTGVTSEIWSLTQLFFRAGSVLLGKYGDSLTMENYLPPFSSLLFPYPVFPRYPRYPFTDDPVLATVLEDPNGKRGTPVDDWEEWDESLPQRPRLSVDLHWKDLLNGEFSYKIDTGMIYPERMALEGIIIHTNPAIQWSLQRGDANVLTPVPLAPSETTVCLGTEADGRSAMPGVKPGTKVYQTTLLWSVKVPFPYPSVPPYKYGGNPANFVLFAATSNPGVGWTVNNSTLFGTQPYYRVPVVPPALPASNDQAADGAHGNLWIWTDESPPGPGPDFPKSVVLLVDVTFTELEEWSPFTLTMYDEASGSMVKGIVFTSDFTLALISSEGGFSGTIEGGNTLSGSALSAGSYTGWLKIDSISQTPQTIRLNVTREGVTRYDDFEAFENWEAKVNAPAAIWDDEEFDVVARLADKVSGSTINKPNIPTLTVDLIGATIEIISESLVDGEYTATCKIHGIRSQSGHQGVITADYSPLRGIPLVATDTFTYQYPVITVVVEQDYKYLGEAFEYRVKYYDEHQGIYVERDEPTMGMDWAFPHEVGYNIDAPTWDADNKMWVGEATISTLDTQSLTVTLQAGCPDGDGGFFVGTDDIPAAEDVVIDTSIVLPPADGTTIYPYEQRTITTTMTHDSDDTAFDGAAPVLSFEYIQAGYNGLTVTFGAAVEVSPGVHTHTIFISGQPKNGSGTPVTSCSIRIWAKTTPHGVLVSDTLDLTYSYTGLTFTFKASPATGQMPMTVTAIPIVTSSRWDPGTYRVIPLAELSLPWPSNYNIVQAFVSPARDMVRTLPVTNADGSFSVSFYGFGPPSGGTMRVQMNASGWTTVVDGSYNMP